MIWAMADVPANRAETVRCEIRDARGRILLLEKDAASKNPGMLELPGGKIGAARACHSTVDEQRGSVVREVLEETGLDIGRLPIEGAGSFSYAFEAEGVPYERDVHLWRVRLTAGDHAVTINRTMRADGDPEDKHAGFRWVAPEEFRRLRQEGRIAANSTVPARLRP